MSPRPCIGQCGRSVRRSTGLVICTPCSTRARTLMRQIPLQDEPNAESRRSARFWIDAQTVAAALTGDLAEAARRIAYRAEHGLYSDPDRAPVAAGG